METAMQAIGILGAAILAVSYFLVSRGTVSSSSKPYHVLNLGGAIGIVANSLFFGALGPTLLNVLWACIAVFHLFAGGHANHASCGKDA